MSFEIVHEWSGRLETFSRPQVIENSRQYLFLRTDILQKTVAEFFIGLFFFPLAGLFAAAHDMNIEWVIVKGISHFSDDSNTPDEAWKSFASIMAASLVSNMLNDPVVFKEWPHYEGNVTSLF